MIREAGWPAFDRIETRWGGVANTALAVSAQSVAGNKLMRPIAGFRNKPGPHRVHQDVIRLLMQRFIMPKPMVEKILLPGEAAGSCRPAFEIEDRLAHRMSWVAETNQAVDVIGHDDENAGEPDACFVEFLPADLHIKVGAAGDHAPPDRLAKRAEVANPDSPDQYPPRNPGGLPVNGEAVLANAARAEISSRRHGDSPGNERGLRPLGLRINRRLPEPPGRLAD